MALLEVLIFLTFIVLSLQFQPRIDTHLGTIIGERIYFDDIPVNTFFGIPYAKPPVNEYRFKKPYPIEKLTEPFLANHLPPGCVQFSSSPFPILDDLPGLSIDCLYLNIWTPQVEILGEKKAVMFFVHGGGFRISSSRIDLHDGRVLSALGDVIVVTTNYRLGTEGFLYFGTDDAPGNMGLYDILEALKWVHSNIESFGGDRNQITLFGESAGAIAISMFLVSPLAQDLFVRAIFESGSAANLDAEDNDKDFRISLGVAKEVGCSSEDNTSIAEIVSCLRGKDALELTKTVGKVIDSSQRGLYPRYGDEILPWNARKALIEGNFKSKDILIGNNKNEGSTIITKVFKDEFGFFGDKLSHINKTFGENIIRKNFQGFSDVDAVIQHYLNDNDDTDVLQQVESASGDFSRICPSVYLAESVAAKSNRVFYYAFTQRSSVTPWAPWMGVPHLEELAFVFGHPLRYYQQYSESDQVLSRRMVNIWTTFAKTGIVRNWPLYSCMQYNYMVLNTNGMSPENLSWKENCEFFRPYFGFNCSDSIHCE